MENNTVTISMERYVELTLAESKLEQIDMIRCLIDKRDYKTALTAILGPAQSEEAHDDP